MEWTSCTVVYTTGVYIELYIRIYTVSHCLVRLLIRFRHGHGTGVNFLKDTAFTDTLEWPECNSDKATVGSVVCTVYTDGQPYKPCGLCQTGLRLI